MASTDQHISHDVLFAENFSQRGGKFIFCEKSSEVIEALKALKFKSTWNHIFYWEHAIQELFEEAHFQRNTIGYTLENSNAGISLCEGLIAESGAILLSPRQASRRRLPIFPATHIILAFKDQLRSDLSEGLDLFREVRRDELPSIIELGDSDRSNRSGGGVVLDAQGPEDVFVLFVDENAPEGHSR